MRYIASILYLAAAVHATVFIPRAALEHLDSIEASQKEEYNIHSTRPKRLHSDQLPVQYSVADHAPDQEAFQGVGSQRFHKHGSAPLELYRYDFFGLPFYFTNIAISTPDQPFRVLIDIGWGGLMVRSVECFNKPYPDCPDFVTHFDYNESLSATSENLDERFEVHLPAHYIRGDLLRDTAHLIDVPVENITFGGIDTFYGENYIFYFLASVSDGALGFAPPNPKANSYGSGAYPNLLSILTQNKALNHNALSFSLPRNMSERGHLGLGTAPQDLDSEHTIHLPLNTTYAKRWQTPIQRISLRGSTQYDLDRRLHNVQAEFALITGLGLSYELAKELASGLNATFGDDWYLPVVWHNDPSVWLHPNARVIPFDARDAGWRYKDMGWTRANGRWELADLDLAAENQQWDDYEKQEPNVEEGIARIVS